MAKECNKEDCTNPVFGKGYCKWHQYLRADKKTPKRKVFTITPRPPVGLNDKCVNGEAELYKIIWDSNEHKSFLSGRPINLIEGSSFWFNVFAHVLAKGKAKYPKFRLYSKNIIMLLPEEHFLLDHCPEEERKKYAELHKCDWNKVYNLRDSLIEEYKTIFK